MTESGKNVSQVFSADDAIWLTPCRESGDYIVTCSRMLNFRARPGEIRRKPVASWEDWVALARLILAHEEGTPCPRP